MPAKRIVGLLIATTCLAEGGFAVRSPQAATFRRRHTSNGPPSCVVVLLARKRRRVLDRGRWADRLAAHRRAVASRRRQRVGGPGDGARGARLGGAGHGAPGA